MNTPVDQEVLTSCGLTLEQLAVDYVRGLPVGHKARHLELVPSGQVGNRELLNEPLKARGLTPVLLHVSLQAAKERGCSSAQPRKPTFLRWN